MDVDIAHISFGAGLLIGLALGVMVNLRFNVSHYTDVRIEDIEEQTPLGDAEPFRFVYKQKDHIEYVVECSRCGAQCGIATRTAADDDIDALVAKLRQGNWGEFSVWDKNDRIFSAAFCGKCAQNAICNLRH